MPAFRSKSALHYHSNPYSKENIVLKRIKLMHSNVTNKHKSSLLSLISGCYSRNDLKEIGFQFSNTQYHTAMNKVKSNTFSLNDYQRHIPNSKKAVNQDIITLITNSLSSNSHESTVVTNQNELVYFFRKTKI